MKLENQELVQKLKQILKDYPGIEYDERRSEPLDDAFIVKVSADAGCNINDAADIARRLSESTGDNYIPQLSASSDESTLDNLRSFKLSLPKPHRNIRITYPDSKNGTLMVDVVQNTEWSLNISMSDPLLWSFAEGNELEIHFNIFAQPNYRTYLRTLVNKIVRNYNESPNNNDLLNSELNEEIIDGHTDSRD